MGSPSWIGSDVKNAKLGPILLSLFPEAGMIRIEISRICQMNRYHARIQKILSEGSNFDKVFVLFFVVFFSLMSGGRIQVPLEAGHHWLASESPLNDVSLACR